MSADKYSSTFPGQTEAIVYIFMESIMTDEETFHMTHANHIGVPNNKTAAMLAYQNKSCESLHQCSKLSVEIRLR